MKKTDLFLIAAVVALSGLLYFLLYQKPVEGTSVSIFIDGELVRWERISDIESPIVIENEYGSNIIEIGSDTVAVTWADCVSQVCVRTGSISRPGEVIACLPHHLLITIEGRRQSEDIDAIAG